jgi:hypothetical protein
LSGPVDRGGEPAEIDVDLAVLQYVALAAIVAFFAWRLIRGGGT